MPRFVWLCVVALGASCALNPLAVLRPARAIDVPSLHLVGEFSIPPLGRYPSGIGLQFGGISGLAVREDPWELLGVSDDRLGPRVYRFRVSGPDEAFRVTPFALISLERDPAGLDLDPEGIAVTRAGNLLIVSEGIGNEEPRVPPAIIEYGPYGHFVRRLEVRARYLPNLTGPLTQGVRANMGFESLTLSPGGTRMFTATETALVQDGEPADFERGSPARLLEYVERRNTYAPAREFVYPIEPLQKPSFEPALSVNGLVELVALSETELLALERSYVENGARKGHGVNRILIFRVTLAGASDVSMLDSLRGVEGIVPVAKTLLLDLATVTGLSPELTAAGLDNFEGMTFGPRLPDGRASLILVSDDNFNANQRTWFLRFAIGEAGALSQVQ